VHELDDTNWFNEQGPAPIVEPANLNVKQCIYCGDTNSKLTREHILPRGLGGNVALAGQTQAFVLQKATCELCRRITSLIENDCLRANRDYARARLGFKRKDRQPPKMEMIFDLPDGSTGRTNVDADDVLGPITIPSYYEAGALSNRSFPDSPAPCDYHMIVVASARGEILEQSPRVGVELRCDSKMFARMLAKIALGAAVARFGIKGFQPTVRNFILRDQNEGGHWVGGFAGAERRPLPSTQLHRIRVMTRTLAAGTFIIVEVQLFAQHGAPTNYVVVGKPLNN